VWNVYRGSSNGFSYSYKVTVNYWVDRRPYTSEVTTVRQYVPGQVLKLRFDPRNPRRNELVIRSKILKAIPVVILLLLAIVTICLFVFVIPGTAPALDYR
jgi:hypothetical protein